MDDPVIKQFPHCDPNILHRPGACEFCDMHPEWQELREVWGINFSGEEDKTKSPCPSERHRPAHISHRWIGNQATREPVRTTPKNIYELVNEEDVV